MTSWRRLRRGVWDPEDSLPRPGGRHFEPVRDDVRLRRSVRLAERHRVLGSGAHRLRYVHRYARHSRPGRVLADGSGAGAAITNGETISASPSDGGSGIDQVEFRYCTGSSCSFPDGTAIGADSTVPYSVSWNGQPADGTYTIVARATDNVGNTTASTERTVTVDNTGPTSVLSLNKGTRPDLQYFDSATDTYYYNPAATGDFSLSDAASDPAGVQSVDFPAIADTGFTGPATTDGTAPYDSGSYTFTAASASTPGSQTVVVTDTLGNATNDSFDIVRDANAPSGGSVS